ncbi:hypothetical protein HUK80_06425 [Flavobacterium sp. MAH-1]|uniref:WG containing repeat-containing protein n=1 Tax=Flavobacterium agri TaxID=2743471 RepID=A0A7Y9C5L9_9FLAO|nr:hypothetical protein [Flavobacterium agri]NUY80524.1 hypothetical protein [Flavobacterium agri]NYA70549.1 hypothetical protein [Flavobacterium agri]
MHLKITTLSLLLTAFLANAQDKAVNVELPSKNVFTDYYFSESGKAYVASNNAKDKQTNLQFFDENLNQKFAKNFASQYKGLGSFFGRGMNAAPVAYNMFGTRDGEYLICNVDDLLFDSNGASRKYNRFEEISGFETVFRIFTNKYDLHLGKKKKGNEGPYFYRTTLADLSKKPIKLEFPDFDTKIGGTPTKVSGSNSQAWEDAGFNDSQFYMVSKELNKERNENQYNIAGFDYEGNVVTKISIPVKLKGKYFALSNSGFGGYKTVDYGIVGASAMDENATGNVYFEDGFYYIYGLFSKEKGDLNKVKYHGFYINKYDTKGDLVWTFEKPITQKGFNATQRPLAVEARFVKTGSRIAFRISNIMEKYALFFSVDGNDGKLLKEASPTFDIEGNRYENFKGGTFATGYYVKAYSKKHMDINTLFASFLNPEVEAFLKSPASEDLNYNCKITPAGIYMIEENYKDKAFRLLKFDWK